MSVLAKEKQQKLQDKFQAILGAMLREEENKYCADCDAKGPRWASWNLGVFICIRCAGIHRNLGVHISRVKSVNLDQWTAEQIASMQTMGNKKGRAIYECHLSENFRRSQNESAMEQFIRNKYEQKKWMAKDWTPQSSASNKLQEFREEEKSTVAPRENKVNAAVFNIGPPMRTSYSAQRLSNPSATSDRQPVQLKLQQQPQQQQQPLSQPPPQPQPPVQANLLLLDFDSVEPAPTSAVKQPEAQESNTFATNFFENFDESRLSHQVPSMSFSEELLMANAAVTQSPSSGVQQPQAPQKTGLDINSILALYNSTSPNAAAATTNKQAVSPSVSAASFAAHHHPHAPVNGQNSLNNLFHTADFHQSANTANTNQFNSQVMHQPANSMSLLNDLQPSLNHHQQQYHPQQQQQQQLFHAASHSFQQPQSQAPHFMFPSSTSQHSINNISTTTSVNPLDQFDFFGGNLASQATSTSLFK